MKTAVIFSVILFGSFSAFAQQTGRDVAERVKDHQQITVDKATLQRDAQELDAFKSRLDLYTTAYAALDKPKLAELKTGMVEDMKREIGQSENKLERAKKEVVASGSEVRSDNREIHHDRRDLANGNYRGEHDRGDLARDKANRVDDLKDRHDDREDAQSIEKRLQNQRALLAQWEDTPVASLTAFVKTMENDLAATRRELGEDRSELREDRRETREDVRERRE